MEATWRLLYGVPSTDELSNLDSTMRNFIKFSPLKSRPERLREQLRHMLQKNQRLAAMLAVRACVYRCR